MRILHIKLVIFLSLVLLVSGCGEIEFLASGIGGEAEEEHIILKSPRYFLYTQGKKDKLISAEEGTLFEKRMILELHKIKIKFFENGTYVAELTADSGTAFLRDSPQMKRLKDDFILQGNVLYRNVDGSVFKTDSLVWDNAKQRLVCDSKFYMERPTDKGVVVIEGKKFETDKTLSKWKDYGASIRLKSKKK
ncbi:hypothetical protein J7M23_04010 [Candidatus Sumerlaeota bacterium]|nr:hypothetical protein [Candidatus Sumerlaeota bacterium]